MPCLCLQASFSGWFPPNRLQLRISHLQSFVFISSNLLLISERSCLVNISYQSPFDFMAALPVLPFEDVPSSSPKTFPLYPNSGSFKLYFSPGLIEVRLSSEAWGNLGLASCLRVGVANLACERWGRQRWEVSAEWAGEPQALPLSKDLTASGPSLEPHSFSRKDTSFCFLSRRRKARSLGFEGCHIHYALEPQIFIFSGWRCCTVLRPEFNISNVFRSCSMESSAGGGWGGKSADMSSTSFGFPWIPESLKSTFIIWITSSTSKTHDVPWRCHSQHERIPCSMLCQTLVHQKLLCMHGIGGTVLRYAQ